jgi:BirA family biotin operon repressor/biotin-[acetyl-CoA-carboxylase] ligase
MSRSTDNTIIDILADGNFHSGQAIATKLQISRTSVWKRIQSLKDQFGLTVHAVSGKGYWLPGGLDLVNEQELAASISDKDVYVSVFSSIDSTNQHMLECADIDDQRWGVCVAEMQTQGRGRRGRQWLSSYGRNIQMSIGVFLNMPMVDVSGLSLAAGVVLAQFLEDTGVQQGALKWPNDIHISGKKVAGLLLEVKGEAEGPVKAVLGIGLNLDMSQTEEVSITQPFTDIKSHLNGMLPSRTTMIAELTERLYLAIQEYQQKGLGGFLERWKRYDLYLDQEVIITSAANQFHGIYRGLDEQGRLLLETGQSIKAFSAGEVSLRKQDEDV